MFRIVGKRIEITRGDSGIMEITLQNGGSQYILADDDELVLTVKESVTKDEYKLRIVAKRGDNGRYVFEFTPQSTKNLKFRDYVYDVQLSMANGNVVSTVITPSVFKVLEEVS